MGKVFRGEIRNIADLDRQMEEVLKKVPLYYDDNKLWYRWNFEDFKWELVDETDILISIDEETDIANISQRMINSQIITALKMASRKKRPRDLRNTQVQIKSKIVDVASGEEMDASPDYFCFNPIEWEVGESEETPTIDSLMVEWVGKENTKKMYQWIAYQMLPEYIIHRVFILIGNGSNGKSTFIDLLRRFIGDNNYSAGDYETVFGRRFGTSILYKKLSVLMPESDFGKISNTATFKSATGGDAIPVEFKNKGVFNYKNYAKVTISANSLPPTLDKTDSFYRRVNIVDFPNQFKEKYDVLGSIPDYEFNNLACKCLRLLKELIKEGIFDKEKDIDKKREKYEKLSNPLSVFIEDELDENSDHYISKREFNTKANRWLRDHSHRSLTNKEITKFMKEMYQEGWGSFVCDKGEKRSERVWMGVKWKGEEVKISEERID
ncbi:hypothetical protein GF336_00365 [Candidatus Woesearchaeota archaeon]|nr:hypothetical protein [Candidatus Woesearchaeota archaeon]